MILKIVLQAFLGRPSEISSMTGLSTHRYNEMLEIGYLRYLGNRTFLFSDIAFYSSAIVETFRGKMLGGSSGLNSLAWNRASSEDYDVWGSFAPHSDWNWSGLLPFFKKAETVAEKPPNPYPGIDASAAEAASRDFAKENGLVGPINV